MSSTARQVDESESWRSVRERVLDRDGHACRFCGMSNEEHKEEHEQGLHAHHVLPRNDGGEDHPGNLITVCTSCHRTIESAHADAVSVAVSNHKKVEDYAQPGRLMGSWTSNASGLYDDCRDYLERHPTIKTRLGVYPEGDLYLGVGEDDLRGVSDVEIRSEHHLFFVLGWAEAQSICGYRLDDVFTNECLQQTRADDE